MVIHDVNWSTALVLHPNSRRKKRAALVRHTISRRQLTSGTSAPYQFTTQSDPLHWCSIPIHLVNYPREPVLQPSSRRELPCRTGAAGLFPANIVRFTREFASCRLCLSDRFPAFPPVPLTRILNAATSRFPTTAASHTLILPSAG